MKIKRILTAFSLAMLVSQAFCQDSDQSITISHRGTIPYYKYSVGISWLSFANFGAEKTNTLHYELHFRYKFSQTVRIGIKIATWIMFAPMGMPMQEQFKFDESNFYPGRLREDGIGFTYQRMLWKGLFTTVEIMPQLKHI